MTGYIKVPLSDGIKITKAGVLTFLYIFFALGAVFAGYHILFGRTDMGILLLVVGAINAVWAIRDAKKSKWGDEFDG